MRRAVGCVLECTAMGQGKKKGNKAWTVRPNKKLAPKKKRPRGNGAGFMALVTGEPTPRVQLQAASVR